MSRRSRLIRKSIEKLNPSETRQTSVVANVTTVDASGLRLNSKINATHEKRDQKIMQPYGISSSGLPGMPSQTVICDKEYTTVGVYDKDKPPTKPGEIIVYSVGDARIKLSQDGTVDIFSCGDANIRLLPNGDVQLFSRDDVSWLKINADGTITAHVSSGNLNLGWLVEEVLGHHSQIDVLEHEVDDLQAKDIDLQNQIDAINSRIDSYHGPE